MAQHTVEKIGGTSISNTEGVLNNIIIGDRSGDELYNRVFVVSAYGGMTNQLLEHKKTGEPGVYALFAGADTEWAWGDAISRVGEAMCAINKDVFGDNPNRNLADNFIRERIEGVRSCLIDLHRLCSYGHFRLDEHLLTVRELLSALGEAHSAHNTALLLRERGINATFVDLTGWREESQPTLDERINEVFKDKDLSKELPIVTGYAHSRDGLMRQYDRGYTEVTFSRIAAITQAREAIIHKEFHLSSADPRLVGEDRVRKLGQTNYDVADQLSNMGMEAIHPRAAKSLRQAGIPLRVKNTFDPKDDGTIIRDDYMSETPRAEIVTGINGIYALEVFEPEMVGVKGYDAAILEAITRHKVRIVTKSSNANTIAHYLNGPLKRIKRVIAELEAQLESATISARRVAIVSAIGSDLNVPGLTATCVNGLSEAGIEIRGVHQLLRNVDIQFILDEDDFDDATRALHKVLIEAPNSTKSNAPAGASGTEVLEADGAKAAA